MNKIQWAEWGKEVFEKAHSTGKPIILDITGSWCHWCHVMDNTSYSDAAVVDMINKHFIPVRVDTDKRPDINRRYNLGGWPTTAFLDKEGSIITGGTYIPPEQLRRVLRSVLDLYAKNKGKPVSKLQSIRPATQAEELLTEKITKDIGTTIAVSFDIDYGGFGSEPKFPHADALEYALHRYTFHGEREMLNVVTKTLDKMGTGGIYDKVEDGFFRYSTTRDWSIPHFEKMAEDNAKLLAVYTHAYQVTGKETYRRVAEGIARYVQKNLANPSGGFYGSQDADENYYKLGPEARSKTSAPRVDKTFYTNYNAFFISSFLTAGIIFGRHDLADFALKSLDQLLTNAWDGESALHYWGDEKSKVKGLLGDQAPMINALIDAFEFTGELKHLKDARTVADRSLAALFDEKNWGFYDIPESHAQLGQLKVRDKPLDENAVMVLVLLRLSSVTADDRYNDRAGKSLRVFASEYERYGLMAGSFALALDAFLEGPVTITITGQRGSKEFEALRFEALRTYANARGIILLDSVSDLDQIQKLGYRPTSAATAYVCAGKACGPPVEDASRIKQTLDMLVRTETKLVGT